MRLVSIGLLALVGITGALPAQDSAGSPPVTLAPLVVTAARRGQRLKDVVPATEVLTRRDIERSGSADLAGVLTQATGIQLEGGVPAGAGVYLQGLDSRRVLVLLDGQPLIGRLNGNLDLSRVPAAMIERIEIVRGPQSTLYGSEAMGGVVNIITREPSPRLDGRLDVRGGTQGRRDIAAGVRGWLGGTGFVLDGGAGTENLAPGRPGDDATRARRWNLAPKLSWRPGTTTRLEVGALLIGETQRYRAGQLFHFADNTHWTVRASLIAVPGAIRLAPTLSYARFDHLSRAATASRPASDSGARDVQELLQADLALSLPAPGGATADAGIVLRREVINAERVSGGARDLHGAESYVETTRRWRALSITPGMRLSVHERWGSALTPRLAVLLRASPAVDVRFALGSGFRAPDFKELYYDFANPAAGYAVRGNPDLKPERALSGSARIELATGCIAARGGVFLTRFRDFIAYGAPDVSGTYTLANIARGWTAGAELDGAWTRGRLTIEAGYAWLGTRDEATGAPLLGRAPHTGRLRLGAAAGPAVVSAALQVTGRTPLRGDSAGRVSEQRPAFARVDMRTVIDLGWSIELTAAVENVFDRRLAGSWPGFTGRRLVAGLGWRLAGG